MESNFDFVGGAGKDRVRHSNYLKRMHSNPDIRTLDTIEVYDKGHFIVRAKGFPGEQVNFLGLKYSGVWEFSQAVYDLWDQQ